MLIGKTRTRLERLAGPPELMKLVKHEGDIQLNGRPTKNTRGSVASAHRGREWRSSWPTPAAA